MRAVSLDKGPYPAHFSGEEEGTEAWFRALRRATKLPITAAGGVRSQREVRALERIGMNAAVGMALYLNRLR